MLQVEYIKLILCSSVQRIYINVTIDIYKRRYLHVYIKVREHKIYFIYPRFGKLSGPQSHLNFTVTLLFSQFYWQRFAKKTMQYVTEVWEMLRKEQRTQKVGGRGEPWGLQIPKKNDTHLYWVGELLFVAVLIDLLKQIFTQLSGKEKKHFSSNDGIRRYKRGDK